MTACALPSPERRLWWAFVAAVLLLGAIVYAPARHFGFLNLDDDLFIRDNPWLAMGWHWPSLRWAFLANLTEYSSTAEYWGPLTLLSRLADAQLYGMNAGPFHVTSVLLHLVNTVLLGLALRQITGKAGRSAMVALLFLVHPLNVEPVCWLSARKDVLNATFFLLTFWAYGWYVRRQSGGRYAVVLLAYVACLMAKPMGVSVPFLLLVVDWCPLKRWPAGPGCWPERFRLCAEKLPFALLAGLAAALAVQSQQDWGAMGGTGIFPLSVRLENALLSYATYLRRIFWPNDLALFYPHPGAGISHAAVALSSVVLVAVTIGAWLLRRRAPAFLAAWLWFGLLLGPVIGLVQIGGQAMADRYAYLAIVGPLAALVWGIASLGRGRWPAVAGALSLVLLTLGASRQALTWRNNETAFTHALSVTKSNTVAHLNLGCALMDEERYEEARAQLLKAVEISPQSSLVWNDLGRAELGLGENRQALACYATALKLKPDSRQSLLFYGRLLRKRGDLKSAEIIFGHLREVAPELPQSYAELGEIYSAEAQWDLAADAWAGFAKYRPEDPNGRRRLAEARENLARAE